MSEAMLRPRRGEILNEIWNAATHGVGFLLSVTALVLLSVRAAESGGALRITTCVLYGSSLVILYLISTLYHSLSFTRAKATLQKLDHISIFLLITGSYLPFGLITLNGTLGWSLFGVLCFITVVGTIAKAVYFHRVGKLSLPLYLGMGWAAIFAAGPLVKALSWQPLVFLLAGGLSYSLGTIFFARDHKHGFHALWHLFVLGGSACHFFAIFGYIA